MMDRAGIIERAEQQYAIRFLRNSPIKIFSVEKVDLQKTFLATASFNTSSNLKPLKKYF